MEGEIDDWLEPPPGCTDRMVDEAFGYSEGRRGVYKVTVTRTMEMTTVIEVEASSRDDAEYDGLIGAAHIPPAKWTVTSERLRRHRGRGSARTRSR